MPYYFVVILSLFLSSISFASEGFLIIAHGSGDYGRCKTGEPSEWEQIVIQEVEEAKKQHQDKLIDLSLSMWGTDCFNKGIERLRIASDEQGGNLEHVVVIPLLLSSHSTVIDMQRFIFKQIPVNLHQYPMEPVNFAGEISYLPAIDYSPIVSEILFDRALALIAEARLSSAQPLEVSDFDLVLVMHGPKADWHNYFWMENGTMYAHDLRDKLELSTLPTIISLRDDADQENWGDRRAKATARLLYAVEDANDNYKTPLILPMLLSKGGVEDEISGRLSNLREGNRWIWTGETLLPDGDSHRIGKYLSHVITSYTDNKTLPNDG